jgi:hypothetical protein
MNVFIEQGLVSKPQKYKEKYESANDSQEKVVPLQIK